MRLIQAYRYRKTQSPGNLQRLVCRPVLNDLQRHFELYAHQSAWEACLDSHHHELETCISYSHKQNKLDILLSRCLCCCSCNTGQQILFSCQLINCALVTYIPIRLTEWILTTMDAEASTAVISQACQLYQRKTIECMRLFETQTCLQNNFA